MAEQVLQLAIKIRDDGSVVLDQTAAKLDHLEQTGKSAGSGITGAFGAAKTSVLEMYGAVQLAKMAFDTVTNAIGGCLSAADEAEKSFVKLEALVKATGKSAGYSAQELTGFAKELRGSTLFSGGEIKNAEAILLTFREISGPMYKDTMHAITDIASVMGQDLSSAAVQVGKALQDPEQGLQALRRVGVSFSKEQQALIKQFVEQNDLLSAQKMILAELNKEFGGVAAAMHSGYAGAVKETADAWADLKRQTGEFLINLLKLPEALKRVGEALRERNEDEKNFQEGRKALAFRDSLLSGPGGVKAAQAYDRYRVEFAMPDAGEEIPLLTEAEQKARDKAKNAKLPPTPEMIKKQREKEQKAWLDKFKVNLGSAAEEGDAWFWGLEGGKVSVAQLQEEVDAAHEKREKDNNKAAEELAKFRDEESKARAEAYGNDTGMAESRAARGQRHEEWLAQQKADEEYAQNAAGKGKFHSATKEEWGGTNKEVPNPSTEDTAIRVQYEMAANLRKKWLDDEKKAIAERNAIFKNTLSMTGQVAGETASLMRQLYEDSGGHARKYFEAYKAFSVAETIIATEQAVMNAYATLPTPVAIPMSAAIAAIGAVKVGLIAAQQPAKPFASGAYFERPWQGNALMGEAGPEILSPVPKLREIVREESRSGPVTVHINMGGVSGMDPTVLALVEARARAGAMAGVQGALMDNPAMRRLVRGVARS